jgi:hypothetical protein
MSELRFNLGYGYLRLRIASKQDAIKIMVLLRGCKSGFYYNQNDSEQLIWANTLKHYSDINKLLKLAGYCDPGSS